MSSRNALAIVCCTAGSAAAVASCRALAAPGADRGGAAANARVNRNNLNSPNNASAPRADD